MRAIRKLDGGRLPILVFSGTIAAADEVRELAALGVTGYINEYSAVQHILPSLRRICFPTTSTAAAARGSILGIPVSYRFGNTIAAALTLNLSKGGVAIRTMSPLEPAIEGQAAVPAAGIEARRRGRVADRVDRPPRRDGAAVREGRGGRSGGDRPVRRPALLQQSQGLSAAAGASSGLRGRACRSRRELFVDDPGKRLERLRPGQEAAVDEERRACRRCPGRRPPARHAGRRAWCFRLRPARLEARHIEHRPATRSRCSVTAEPSGGFA